MYSDADLTSAHLYCNNNITSSIQKYAVFECFQDFVSVKREEIRRYQGGQSTKKSTSGSFVGQLILINQEQIEGE